MTESEAQALISFLNSKGYVARLYNYSGYEMKRKIIGVVTPVNHEQMKQLETNLEQENIPIYYSCDMVGKDYIYY